MRPATLAVVALCAAALMSGCSLFAATSQRSWPPSATGLPTLYYFGDPS